MNARVELNCDLGEGEPWERTRALLGSVDAANVACGGHAGDAATMRAVVTEARRLGVRVGAHPGHAGSFGRVAVPITPVELEALLEGQVGALHGVAAAAGVALSHLKLHGALYHQADADAALAGVVARFVATTMPGAWLVGPPGGRLAGAAAAAGIGFRAEGFLDRGYRADGTLVPRGEPGASVDDVAAVRARLEGWLRDGTVRAVDGRAVRVAADTWCVHGDGAAAVEIARAAASVLRGRDGA